MRYADLAAFHFKKLVLLQIKESRMKFNLSEENEDKNKEVIDEINKFVPIQSNVENKFAYC